MKVTSSTFPDKKFSVSPDPRDPSTAIIRFYDNITQTGTNQFNTAAAVVIDVIAVNNIVNTIINRYTWKSACNTVVYNFIVGKVVSDAAAVKAYAFKDTVTQCIISDICLIRTDAV